MVNIKMPVVGVFPFRTLMMYNNIRFYKDQISAFEISKYFEISSNNVKNIKWNFKNELCEGLEITFINNLKFKTDSVGLFELSHNYLFFIYSIYDF